MSTSFKRMLAPIVVLVLVLALVQPAGAQNGVEEVTPLTPAPSAEDGQMVDETPRLWFVELASPPAVNGTDPAQLRQEKNAFRGNAQRAGLRYRERFAFDTLFNGFSLEVEPGQLPKLSQIPGVKAIYPVVEVARPVAQPTNDPELATALAMTGADVAQSELGYTGRGIRVAIMDTGIDYDHPDLGGDGVDRENSRVFPTRRVVAGYDFVGDAFNADPSSSAYNPTPQPDPYPDDCGDAGHGTHVAGIVGANGRVKGVAPDVVFGAYRVFGCAGSTTADIMIAAMERALADRMQVLNMSIGSAFMTWPQYPTAAAADRLVDRGMVVVASIGNSGANGLYSAGAPGVGNKVIGVASFDNTHVSLRTFTVSPDNAPIGYAPASGAPEPPTTGSLPMARTGTPTTTNDACDPLPAGSLSGKAVLIRRGTCTFYQKAFNAQQAGAAAVVLYNNAPGRFSATVAGTPAITIPVVSISDAEGRLINDRLAGGAVTLTWTSQTGRFVNPTGGLISSFSSFGLNAELTLKPDIGAPGGLINSTYPLKQGGYATISGTSMSSPHVAGTVALLLQARPRTPAAQVRSILQNTAEPKPWWGNPGLGLLDNVHRQGAGMVQIDDAILATTTIEPGKLSLGESQAGPRSVTLTLTNHGTAPVTYALSHTPALSTGPNTNAVSYLTGFATVSFSAERVTVPAGGTATVQATISANPSLPERSLYGGYLVFTPEGDGQTLRVPYAGFKGDYQSIQVLTPTANGFPWLAKRNGTSYVNQPNGATFTLQNGDIPYFLVHFEHQARLLQMEVFEAASGKPVHPVHNTILREEYLPRNSTSTGFFAFAWDGTRYFNNGNDKTKDLPDGSYIVKLSVLKALGDPANPAHWETWTSPVITIDRP